MDETIEAILNYAIKNPRDFHTVINLLFSLNCRNGFQPYRMTH